VLKLETIINQIEKEGAKKRIVIYDIHFCRTGVGFLLHDRNKYIPNYVKESLGKFKGKEIMVTKEVNWRDGLWVDTYYPTIRKATQRYTWQN
jgi:hypothetical protein